ncbi:hypothetical protein MPER_15896, partial [Moniliophthora perniciosa FA553]
EPINGKPAARFDIQVNKGREDTTCEDATIQNKVFFVGDTCHTRSPHAGMGLNTKKKEGHNLAWKLALVLKGVLRPSVLFT